MPTVLLTTVGAGTWTVPEGITSIVVELVSAGAGSGANRASTPVPGNGGDTVFGTLTKIGGRGAGTSTRNAIGNDVAGRGPVTGNRVNPSTDDPIPGSQSGSRDISGLDTYGTGGEIFKVVSSGTVPTSFQYALGGGGNYGRVDSYSVVPGETIAYTVGAGGVPRGTFNALRSQVTFGGRYGIGDAIRITYTVPDVRIAGRLPLVGTGAVSYTHLTLPTTPYV